MREQLILRIPVVQFTESSKCFIDDYFTSVSCVVALIRMTSLNWYNYTYEES